MPTQMTQYDKPYKYVCSYPHHHQCSSTTTHSQRRKGGKWGKVQSAAPWHFHPSHLAACLLTLCSTADYIAQSPAKATAALPRARREPPPLDAAPHTVRQGGGEWRRGGGVHASPIRQQPALARGISHRSRRSMATTTLQKGNEKKNLVQKNEQSYTNRIQNGFTSFITLYCIYSYCF